MTEAERSAHIEWEPTLVALAIAMVLLWLAGGPFTLHESDSGGGVLPTFALLAPSGELSAFPTEFRWLPVPDAEIYEITVTPMGEKTPLFRQRGSTTILDVDVQPGFDPPAGSYVCEVVALRGGTVLARATRSFHVEP